MSFRDEVVSQLNRTIEQGMVAAGSYARGASYGDAVRSHLPEADLRAFLASATAAVHRIAGPTSSYAMQLLPPPDGGRRLGLLPEVVEAALGVVRALRDDVAAGYWERLETRIRANTEDDFLVIMERPAPSSQAMD